MSETRVPKPAVTTVRVSRDRERADRPMVNAKIGAS